MWPKFKYRIYKLLGKNPPYMWKLGIGSINIIEISENHPPLEGKMDPHLLDRAARKAHEEQS